MFKNGKWIKVGSWHGRLEELECRDHWFAWSGRTPCTGIRRCLLCGKPESEVEHAAAIG